MALLILGNRFVRELEKQGALAAWVPLEGGFEGRYQRRLREAGYESLHMTARGLGDLAAYLESVHGVRAPHLGKKNTGSAAVGERHFVPPILSYRLAQLSPQAKGIALWLIEGQVLSRQELAYLVDLTQRDSRVKVVVEVGGERFFRWEALSKVVSP